MTGAPDVPPRLVRAAVVRGAIAGASVAVVVALGCATLVPDAAPGLRHTSVLNALFDSRWMIGGTRILALAVAVYLLASIVVRVARDQWLRHVGPVDVETDATIKRVTQDQAELQDALDGANRTIERLRSEYAALLAQHARSGQTGGLGPR